MPQVAPTDRRAIGLGAYRPDETAGRTAARKGLAQARCCAEEHAPATIESYWSFRARGCQT